VVCHLYAIISLTHASVADRVGEHQQCPEYGQQRRDNHQRTYSPIAAAPEGKNSRRYYDRGAENIQRYTQLVTDHVHPKQLWSFRK